MKQKLLSYCLCAMTVFIGANAFSQPTREKNVENFAALALKCVHQEYPNKISHSLNSADDIKAPHELYPAFYGCFDWHSSVHGHWLLARFAHLYPNNKLSLVSSLALQKSINQENITKEVEYLTKPGRASFERPYGLAWALQLHNELQEWGMINQNANELASIYEPLAKASATKLKTWLPKLYYPVRVGEHSQTAFGLGLAYDWAKKNDKELADLIMARAKSYYSNDINCPLNYEPSGEDFLSPCLGEASLMARLMTPDEYAKWLKVFMPNIPYNGTTDWLKPAIVTDRSDPKLAHLDGLNLSRAWMLRRIMTSLPLRDARRISILNASNEHEQSGLIGVTGEHYEGGHWLGTFAMYLTTGAGVEVKNIELDATKSKKKK